MGKFKQYMSHDKYSSVIGKYLLEHDWLQMNYDGRYVHNTNNPNNISCMSIDKSISTFTFKRNMNIIDVKINIDFDKVNPNEYVNCFIERMDEIFEKYQI